MECHHHNGQVDANHQHDVSIFNQEIDLENILTPVLTPFHVSKDVLNDAVLNKLDKVPTAPIMEGIKHNLFIADVKGSKIFSKAGLNYIVGNEGKDSFFFSLCTTKVHNDQTSVVHNFEDMKDKIYLCCSKRVINPEDIHIYYNKDNDFTLLMVDHPTDNIAISFLGNHELSQDIILNEKWIDHIA